MSTKRDEWFLALLDKPDDEIETYLSKLRKLRKWTYYGYSFSILMLLCIQISYMSGSLEKFSYLQGMIVFGFLLLIQGLGQLNTDSQIQTLVTFKKLRELPHKYQD